MSSGKVEQDGGKGEKKGPVAGAAELREEILATATLTDLVPVLVNRPKGPRQRMPGEKSDGSWPDDLVQAAKNALLERLRRFTWNLAEHERILDEARAAERAAAAGVAHQQPQRFGGGRDEMELGPEEDLEGFSGEFANANLVALLRVATKHKGLVD
jgi:hypothetical protein